MTIVLPYLAHKLPLFAIMFRALTDTRSTSSSSKSVRQLFANFEETLQTRPSIRLRQIGHREIEIPQQNTSRARISPLFEISIAFTVRFYMRSVIAAVISEVSNALIQPLEKAEDPFRKFMEILMDAPASSSTPPIDTLALNSLFKIVYLLKDKTYDTNWAYPFLKEIFESVASLSRSERQKLLLKLLPYDFTQIPLRLTDFSSLAASSHQVTQDSEISLFAQWLFRTLQTAACTQWSNINAFHETLCYPDIQRAILNLRHSEDQAHMYKPMRALAHQVNIALFLRTVIHHVRQNKILYKEQPEAMHLPEFGTPSLNTNALCQDVAVLQPLIAYLTTSAKPARLIAIDLLPHNTLARLLRAIIALEEAQLEEAWLQKSQYKDQFFKLKKEIYSQWSKRLNILQNLCVIIFDKMLHFLNRLHQHSLEKTFPALTDLAEQLIVSMELMRIYGRVVKDCDIPPCGETLIDSMEAKAFAGFREISIRIKNYRSEIRKALKVKIACASRVEANFLKSHQFQTSKTLEIFGLRISTATKEKERQGDGEKN